MSDTQMITFRVMTLEDIDQIMIVEKSAFSVPWSKKAFENELTNNRFATYFVAEYGEQIVGYCGVWVIIDEAHITNLAVLTGFRGRKIGETLLRKAMMFSRLKRAKTLSLECRVSNHIAQNLYRKLGFQDGGIRRKYYSNNGEDALVMWVKL